MTARRCAFWLSLAGAAAGIALVAVRASNVISFSEPLQLFTSGAEHESLYAVWRAAHGRDVYTDPFRIPYVSSDYYNWFYFWFYGVVVRVAQGLFALGDAWIPTITRLTTLVLCTAGAWLGYRSLVDLAPPADRYQRMLALSLILLLFFGPLAGWWVIATNVDFYATVLLIASIHVFCRLYGTRPVTAVLAFCVLAYLTWALKQVYVYGCGAVGLYLLCRRDWRSLAVLVVVMVAAWTITFAIGSDVYARMVFLTGTALVYTPARLLHNLANLSVKTLPLLAGVAAAGYFLLRNPARRRAVTAQPYFRLHAFGLGVTLLFVVPTNMQLGSAENYFFPVVYFLIVLLYLAVRGLAAENAVPRAVWLALAAGWVGNLLAVGAVLAGVSGALTTREWHDRHMAIKACLDRMPHPAFTTSGYNLLPWMYPAEHHFVLTYNYFRDRQAGLSFERGGIGGLIREGYFASLMLGTDVNETFDDARLDQYRRLDGLCAGRALWVRRDLAPAGPAGR